MISADFYPTQQTQFTVEYTDVINNLTYDDPETMAEPYYMGYVKWDDVPTLQHMSKLNIVTGIDEAYVEFVDVTQTENVPWFFTGRYSTSSSSGSGIYIADESTNKYVHPTLGNHNNYGFFNSLEIQRVGSYGSFNLYVFYNIINPSTTPPTISQGASYLQYNSTSISFEDFLKWMNGEIQLFMSVTIGAVQENIYFDYEDFLTGECNKEHTNGELQVWLVDVFTPHNARDYQPNNTLAQWSNQNATLKLHADIDGDIKPFLTNGLYWHSGYSDERYIRLDNAQTLVHYVSGYNGYVMGGFNGRIPYTFFAYGLTGRYYVFGNMIVWKYTSSQTRIARIIPITDIIHFLAPLATRVSTTGINPAYGFADAIAYPLFNDDNSPKWEYVTGLQEVIQDELQEWQYTNITANTFTEDDIPEYEPPSPSGDEDEESGQSIPIQRRLSMGAVSSFITCYGLTAAQVQEFGKKLWSSWVDNGGLVMAMVENFKFLIDSGIASNTGSIDISSVLDFVVSLKVYPCDIRNLFAFSNSDSDGKVYIGRGTYGLEVSDSAIYKAINQLGYLDAGTYNVPRPFGDFRDYTNINITVYVPYCGTIELNPADVIGRTLSGTYVVDVMTGECTFFLEVIALTDSGEHRYIVGTCDGQLGVTIPVSATNSGQIAARRFSDVSQFATTVGGFFNRNMQIGNDIAMQMATLGASGMASKNPEMASAREQNIKMTGSQAYADNALGLLKDVTGQFGNSLTRAAIDAPNISGGSGIASFANPDCVWIQIRHGIYPKVDNYNHTVGKVSTKSAPLSSYHGFTVCHNVDVSSLPCTEEEKSAIKQLLETGVYL